MALIQIIFLSLIHRALPDTSSDFSPQCSARCDMIKEVDALRGEMQVLRQLLNQESLLRMNLDQKIQSQNKLIENMEDELSALNRTFFDKAEDLAPERSMGEINGSFAQEMNKLTLDVSQNAKVQTESLKILESRLSMLNTSLDSKVVNLGQNMRQERTREFNDMEKRLTEIQLKTKELNQTVTKESSSNVAFSSRNAKVSSGIIIFETISVNLGNAYDNSSGTFTAPSTGVYVFQWTVATNEKKNCNTILALNDKEISSNYVESGASPEDSSGSQTVITRMNKGDQVQIKTAYGTCSQIHDLWSSFSGFRYV